MLDVWNPAGETLRWRDGLDMALSDLEPSGILDRNVAVVCMEFPARNSGAQFRMARLQQNLTVSLECDARAAWTIKACIPSRTMDLIQHMA